MTEKYILHSSLTNILDEPSQIRVKEGIKKSDLPEGVTVLLATYALSAKRETLSEIIPWVALSTFNRSSETLILFRKGASKVVPLTMDAHQLADALTNK